MRIGAWAGRALQADPDATVKVAQQVGLTDLCIVANDASAQATGAAKWQPYDEVRVINLAEACRGAGIAPHVMTWAVADAGYMEQMLAWLLRYQVHFDGVQLDVEESWIRRRANHAGVVKAVAPQLQSIGVPLSVTAIGHTAFDLVGLFRPYVKAWIPQVYCTSEAATKWGVDAKTSPARGCARFRGHFPAGAIECGLAGYDATETMLRAAYESARSAGCERVWYWALGSMTATTRAVIASLAR